MCICIISTVCICIISTVYMCIIRPSTVYIYMYMYRIQHNTIQEDLMQKNQLIRNKCILNYTSTFIKLIHTFQTLIMNEGFEI